MQKRQPAKHLERNPCESIYKKKWWEQEPLLQVQSGTSKQVPLLMGFSNNH
jgi:hypothetical protein